MDARRLVIKNFSKEMNIILERIDGKMLKLTAILFVTWVTVTYLGMPSCRKPTKTEITELRNKLNLALVKMQSMQLVNAKLQELLDRKPRVKYENVRRRIFSNTNEYWYYISNWLEEKSKGVEEDSLESFLADIRQRKRSLLSDLEKLAVVDGYSQWRRKEADRLSDLVQRRLKHLQNPPDCQRARKVVCGHDNCGFGCQLHHIVYCLIFAYATERTLILNSKGWRYNTKGWEYVFHPISDTCTSTYNDTAVKYPASDEAKVILLPKLYYLNPKPKFLPMALPEDIAHRIIRFNGDPVSWWIGQMVKYILKPRNNIQEIIKLTTANMNITSPIVGVHIRHTDKIGVEATRHPVSEYMEQVDEYYAQLELTNAPAQRSVYLATDEPRVLQIVRSNYPQFMIHGDASIARSAATRRRYNPHSLTGLLVDMHMLAGCDYLVCTFSSQLGRAVYEMMQSNRVDASTSYSSLDDLYHFVGQNPQERVLIMPAGKSGHIAIGDTIDVSGIQTGYNSKGKNKSAMVPWYKTVEYLQLYSFPKYKDVPLD